MDVRPYPVQYKIVDLSVDQTIVSNSPCLLMGIYVNSVISAHTCSISDGTNVPVLLKASLAAGTKLEFGGIEMKTNLVVNPNAAATGTIVVAYIPLS